MGAEELPVPAPLTGVVEAAWAGGDPAADPAGSPAEGPEVQAILPDGCMDVFWTGAELAVAGPDTGPHPYRRSPGALTCGLRFAPGRLPALLGVPAAALRDRRVPLAELHPALTRAFTGRLTDAAGRGDRSAVVGLLGEVARALPAAPVDPAVTALATRLDSPDPADAAVAAVAEALGWTTRTLHRRSLAAFGYGPAVLRRVLRFRRATALLRAGVAPAEVAARAGYADQPHLSRELRALGGLSPAAVRAGAAAA